MKLAFNGFLLKLATEERFPMVNDVFDALALGVGGKSKARTNMCRAST